MRELQRSARCQFSRDSHNPLFSILSARCSFLNYCANFLILTSHYACLHASAVFLLFPLPGAPARPCPLPTALTPTQSIKNVLLCVSTDFALASGHTKMNEALRSLLMSLGDMLQINRYRQ